MIVSRKFPINVLPLLVICLASLVLFACSREEIKGKEGSLVKENVTAGKQEVVYPDAPPSVPDGQVVWQKLNCAVCHGIDGQGKSGKSSMNLADKTQMMQEKPVDQYQILGLWQVWIRTPGY